MEFKSMEIIKYLIYDFKNFIYLFFNNKKLEPESINVIEVKSVLEIPINFTGMVKYYDGTQYWLKKRILHREDGPAVIFPDGNQYWFLNGVRMTPMEVFDQLPDEQKERVLWNLNQWK